MEFMNLREKQLMEKHSVVTFCEELEKDTGRKLKYVEHRDKPDTVVVDENGNRIGIEVTHLFYSQGTAKVILGREGAKTAEISKKGDIIKLLNELISKKIEKAKEYIFEDPMYLLIHAPSPLVKEETFRESAKVITVPSSRYKEVWLILEQEEGQEIFQLG